MASFTGVYYVLVTMKNRAEVAKYGSKAELHKFGDFKNFTLARNYDQELSLRLTEKQKNRYTNSEFALMTNKATAQVSDALKSLFDN